MEKGKTYPLIHDHPRQHQLRQANTDQRLYALAIVVVERMYEKVDELRALLCGRPSGSASQRRDSNPTYSRVVIAEKVQLVHHEHVEHDLQDTELKALGRLAQLS